MTLPHKENLKQMHKECMIFYALRTYLMRRSLETPHIPNNVSKHGIIIHPATNQDCIFEPEISITQRNSTNFKMHLINELVSDRAAFNAIN